MAVKYSNTRVITHRKIPDTSDTDDAKSKHLWSNHFVSHKNESFVYEKKEKKLTMDMKRLSVSNHATGWLVFLMY